MNKKFIPLILLAVIAIFFVILVSNCGGKKKEPKNEKETDIPQITQKSKISSIKFYLETSGSMKGYFGGGTDFAVTVNNFVVDLNAVKEQTKMNLFFINSEVTPYEKPINTFITDVASLNLQMGRSSEIHKMIKEISDNHKENDISIFVSDFILSFPAEEVKKNREINKENVQSVLKPYIKEEIAKLKKKEMAILIYAFTSNFNGKYYNYQNQAVNCAGCQRPYYMWIIGKSALINDLQERISKMNFSPKAEMAFGMTAEPITNQQLITFTEKGKQPYRLDKQNQNLISVEAKPKQTFKFYSAIDLSSLPLKYQDEEFLKENLKLETRNQLQVEVLDVEKSTTFLTKLKNARDTERTVKNGDTHYILFGASDMIGKNTTISITLAEPRSTDWTKNWSTDNDLDISQNENKTFAFSYLIDGVKEAYNLAETQKRYLIDYKINLSTEK